jgi:glutaminase
MDCANDNNGETRRMNDRAMEAGLSYSMIHEGISTAYERCAEIAEGDVARYIPELAAVDPDQFGIAVMSANGATWKFGAAETEFTIQSVSKAFTYCLALELIGRDKVFEHVGVEPSGDAFNAIILDPATNRPFNPMVNAGAITVAALLYRALGNDAEEYILDRLSRAAGRRLGISESVYRSEAETGHRNRAIAHLLVNVGVADAPVEPALDLYFRQCSILVTATDLAQMGATMANLGHNPTTKDPVFDVSAVRDTLSVMITCGMYDYTGHWVLDVGVPAKSGVGGGIVGVVNRQLGIGTFSPRLDRTGNSVRGLAIFRQLADELGLHAFDCMNRGSDLLRAFL